MTPASRIWTSEPGSAEITKLGRVTFVRLSELEAPESLVAESFGLPGFATSFQSWTVTVNVALAALPARSAALQVTVVVPIAKALPDAALQELVTPGTLS